MHRVIPYILTFLRFTMDDQSYCPNTDNPVARSHGMAIYLPAPGLNRSSFLHPLNAKSGLIWWNVLTDIFVKKKPSYRGLAVMKRVLTISG